MQIIKLYIRLIKKILPVMFFYVLMFSVLIVVMHLFSEQGYQGIVKIGDAGGYRMIPVAAQVFRRNITMLQCYMNDLCFILVLSIVSGCGYFLQILHESGIKRRNQMAPVSAGNLRFQIILSNFIFMIGMDIIFTGIGILVFGDWKWNIKFALYYVNTMFFSITMVAISYLVSHMVKKKRSVFLFSAGYALLSCGLGGVIVPQGFFPDLLVKLAEFAPAYWFVRCNAQITEVSWNLHYLWPGIRKCLLMEIFWALAFFALAVAIEKVQHEKDLY